MLSVNRFAQTQKPTTNNRQLTVDSSNTRSIERYLEQKRFFGDTFFFSVKVRKNDPESELEKIKCSGKQIAESFFLGYPSIVPSLDDD
jgi:hypothetical protein